MEGQNVNNGNNSFRFSFKHFKQKDNILGPREILKLNEELNLKCVARKPYVPSTELIQEIQSLGLKHTDKWIVKELECPQGLILIKNPFTSTGQRYWTARSLKSYTKKPYRLNIDNHQLLREDEDWWEYSIGKKDDDILKKLRWSTLGYQHNWDSKVYAEEDRVSFPDDLLLLTKCVAQVLGFANFSAEAAIVNFYHVGSTLSGHTDHSEHNLSAPLFSFSFGQSAVFLAGGTSLEDTPVALIIESGDVVVMSGHSRLCYHGVPKVFLSSDTPWDGTDPPLVAMKDSVVENHIAHELTEPSFWKPFSDYLQKSRINLNVRQLNVQLELFSVKRGHTDEATMLILYLLCQMRNRFFLLLAKK